MAIVQTINPYKIDNQEEIYYKWDAIAEEYLKEVSNYITKQRDFIYDCGENPPPPDRDWETIL